MEGDDERDVLGEAVGVGVTLGLVLGDWIASMGAPWCRSVADAEPVRAMMRVAPRTRAALVSRFIGLLLSGRPTVVPALIPLDPSGQGFRPSITQAA
jgi:hypothetical protein